MTKTGTDMNPTFYPPAIGLVLPLLFYDESCGIK